MKWYLAFIFLFQVHIACSQALQNHPLLIQVIDSDTKSGIPYATLFAKHKYFAADQRGSINIESLIVGDSIRISSIGYTSRVFVLTAPDNRYTIELKPNVQQLADVELKNGKRERITMGNEKNTSQTGTYLTGLNQSYALYVSNSLKLTGIIESLVFEVSNNLKGIKEAFKINVYSKNDDSRFPAAELLHDDVIVRNPSGKTKVKVDISKYEIDLPENGFFIVAQILSSEYYAAETTNFINSDFTRVPAFQIFMDRSEGPNYSLIKYTRTDWYNCPNKFKFSAVVLKQ